MSDIVIKLNDILLNNFYLKTKKILFDMCYNLSIVYNTQENLYKSSNDFSNIIFNGTKNLDYILLNSYSFDINLNGPNNVVLDYSSNLIYNDLGFVISRINNDVSYISQLPNITSNYLVFNILDINVETQTDLCLNLVGNYNYNYIISSNNIKYTFFTFIILNFFSQVFNHIFNGFVKTLSK